MPVDRYQFWKRRACVVVNIATATERRLMVSAFGRWMARREGTLKMTTRRDGDGYVAVFTGISPAESNIARLSEGKE